MTPISLLYVSGGGMYCVSCDICVYHLGLCVFFPGVFLSSRVTGACPVTTDLIMRVNVRTTTPTTTTTATTATTSTTTIIDHVACVVLDVFTRSCGVCVRRSVQFSNDNGTEYNQPRVSAGGSHIYAHCIFSSIVLEW